ncbi:cryptochrome/photolyase family protein [Sessilibacter corallicola]|uniref:cryptochrome/photolyase family protein n=1 Tax=Sessilibacter corallicola TaxID=2904075 RepID=UPI001E522BE0|nr:cryptochrome/photolyase family protein [Sessilibacter corallicola]MCE2029421.1 cryptochrome/photolyase family protein [Sessilibacter corallicola]
MKIDKNYRTVRLILGDQLNSQHSWFNSIDETVLYVIAELKQEATYVKHHIQKLCAFFSAMESFAQELTHKGHQVLHLTLDETEHFSSIIELLATITASANADVLEYQQPDEYRLLTQLRKLLPQALGETQINETNSEHFLIPLEKIRTYVKPQQHNRMESFYRKMRKRFDILMDSESPEGGQWNYDSQNREKIKTKDLAHIPQPMMFGTAVDAYFQRIKAHNIPYFGEYDAYLLWPVTRTQSLQLLDYFCEYCLPNFGRFQDAMIGDHPFQWSLYHSRLSFSLNTKQIHPMEVITAAIQAYHSAPTVITLPQVEGFVRQILGWREYIRCVYWINMPEYPNTNELSAHNKLPKYFWDGSTKMACMKQAIGQSLKYAYAHHIQRLMVTGNFCLLTGISPEEVNAWYLGIYIDAIEWVEMPNTHGMSLFADGGYVATKPYSASGNYINKMSDYCKHCFYDIKQKTSENSCPFNSLYWNFMHKHQTRLANNPRNIMIYRNWNKLGAETQQATLARAQWCIDNLSSL